MMMMMLSVNDKEEMDDRKIEVVLAVVVEINEVVEVAVVVIVVVEVAVEVIVIVIEK